MVILDDDAAAVNGLTAAHYPTVTALPVQQMPSPSTPTLPQQGAGPPVRSKRYYRRPLADGRMESLAGKVHVETGQSMSLRNARRLVDTYGAKPVEAALKRMVWLRRKDRIRSPAAFLVVASRMEWRVQHDATGLGVPAPRFRGD
jgi:hypothetical protein